uniref:HTH cro/C1-type domain-containing protein n=1 Tax=Aliivibrio fischeri TaxID=668 RepID=H2ERT2_ALIFS|nr:helix-turn-helix transcriptional regulator [Aliivibrio fischeri]AEY78099.1 hypothetical protein [Aliivibrio fischeri]
MTKSADEVQVQLIKLNQEMQDLLDNIITLKDNPNSQNALSENTDLAALLLLKRRELNISIEDLELQTEISFSTVQRTLKEPQNAKLSNVLKICNELGVKLWIEK